MTARSNGDRDSSGRLLADPRRCDVCGEMFQPTKRYVERGTGTTCSRRCIGAKIAMARNAGKTIVVSPRGIRTYGLNVERQCERCAKSFRAVNSRIRRGEGRFCSPQCARLGRRKMTPYNVRHPERVRARRLMRSAIERGELVRPTECPSCGSSKRIEGHHADYSKPLEVEWLCHRCHKRTHGRLKEAA